MSRSKDKIDKALGIGDELKELDKQETDDEKKMRFEERKKAVAQIKKDLRKIRENPDEEFIKENLRELATNGMIALRTIQEEIELNPNGRDVECMATMMNAISSSLKELKEVDNDKKKIDMEQQKIDLKKLVTEKKPGIGMQQNNVFVGSTNDLLKAIKHVTNDNNEIIDVDNEDDEKEDI
jgi:hypothetical protein